MQGWVLQGGGHGPGKMQDGEQARKMGWSSAPISIPGGSTQHPPCPNPPRSHAKPAEPGLGWRLEIRRNKIPPSR